MSNRRIIQNLKASTVNKFILMFQQLALVPAFLHFWGAETYGAWLVLVSIPTFLSMANLGLGTATATEVTLELGAGEERQALTAFLSGLVVLSSILALVLLLIAFVPWPIFIPKELHVVGNVRYVVLFMMISVAANMMRAPFEGFFIARGAASTAIWIQALTSFFQILITLAVLVSGLAPWLLALSILFIHSLGALIYATFSGCPFFKLSSVRVTRKSIYKLFSKGMGFQLGSLWQALYFQGSVWLALILFGPIGAATWGTLRTLSRAGNQLLSLFNQSIFPEIKLAVSRGEHDRVRGLHALTLGITFFVAVSALITLSFFGPWIYRTWTSGELIVPYLAWPLLGIGILINSLWLASAMIPLAYNQPWSLNIPGLISALISLTVMGGFAVFLKDIIVFPLGVLVFESLMALVILNNSLKLLEQRMGALVLQCVKESKAIFYSSPLYLLRRRFFKFL